MAKKKLEGGKGLFHLTLPGPRASLREGGAGAKGEQPDTGTEAEMGEKRCLLVCFPWHVQPAFFNNPRPPVQGWQQPQ